MAAVGGWAAVMHHGEASEVHARNAHSLFGCDPTCDPGSLVDVDNKEWREIAQCSLLLPTGPATRFALEGSDGRFLQRCRDGPCGVDLRLYMEDGMLLLVLNRIGAMVAMCRALYVQHSGLSKDDAVALRIVARIVQRAFWVQAELECLTRIALRADREEAPTPPPAAGILVGRLIQQSFGQRASACSRQQV